MNTTKIFLSVIMLSALIFTVFSPAAYSQTALDLNKKGIELGEKKDYRKAIETFTDAIKIHDVEYARIFHNKGWAYELLGNYTAAIFSYEEALKKNPAQIISAEKLGFLLYKTGEYYKAVIVGEHVIKMDKNNKDVSKWLPDAYIKELRTREERIAREKKAKELEKKKLEDKKILDEKKYIHEKQWIHASLDVTLRTGYYFNDTGGVAVGYQYIPDTGYVFNLAENLYVNFTPLKWLGVELFLANPFLGALVPSDILYHHERLEVNFKLGNFTLGAGAMLNHYFSSSSFNMDLELMDFKIGIIIGYKEDKTEMMFRAYPRLFPQQQIDQTYEYAFFDLQYKYQIGAMLAFYAGFSAHDFLVFDHAAAVPVSNYRGVYDITFGVTLGKIDRLSNAFHIAFSVDITQRVYLKTLGNEDPYSTIPNGQGYFGLNLSGWTTGNPFSGYDATGIAIGLRVDEQINRNFFLYQKFIVEIGDLNKDHHEFNFVIGFAFAY